MKSLQDTLNEGLRSREELFWDTMNFFEAIYGEGWHVKDQDNVIRTIYYDIENYKTTKRELNKMMEKLRKRLIDQGWKVVDFDITANQPYIKIK